MVSQTDLKDMSLPQLVESYPEARKVLMRFGLLTYAETETARHENLEASALVHSVDIDKLLSELSRSLG